MTVESIKTNKGTSIASAAVLITLGSAASRLLGLVREQVIAALFGRTAITDAFVTAITVPTMLYDLVVGGAVSAALIPVFSGYAAADDRAALTRIVSSVLTLTALVLALAVAILWLFADQVISLLGIGLSPEYRDLSVSLVRLALPAVIFLGLSGVVTAVLYARQVFTYPAFCVAAYNASIIAAALVLAPQLGAASLAIGALMGAFLQVAVQVPGLRGMGLRLMLDLRHPGVRRILGLYAPVALGLVVSQVGIGIDRNLASRAGEGAMAAMRFATTLVQLPLGLVVTAAAYSTLPSLSRFANAAEGENGEGDARAGASAAYVATLVMGIRFSLFFILPALVGLAVLREPLVALIFQHGVFDAGDTRQTAWILLFYLPQLPFVAVDQLLIFAFYARKNTLTPMLVGVLGVGVYLGAGISLLGPMQAAGLALANTVQHTVHATVLFVLLARSVEGLGSRALWLPLARLALAALALGVTLVLAGPWLASFWNLATLVGQVGYLLTATTLGGAVYLLAAWALHSPELAQTIRLGKRLIRRGSR
ncbi:MAG: murein biosynthesis integral membrane protein MurJ [Chloroflexota bacterium]